MNTFPPLSRSFRLPVGVELMDRIVKLMGRFWEEEWGYLIPEYQRKCYMIECTNIKILRVLSAVHKISVYLFISFFAFPVILFTVYICLINSCNSFSPLLELCSVLQR